MTDIIRIEGAGLADDIFSIETPDEGEIVWNVTKLNAAALAGRFGGPITMPMSIMPAPRYDLGFLDKNKVEEFKRNRIVVGIPAIAIEAPREHHLRCFCDGQHRLTARYELGMPDFRSYIVPVAMEREFRITMRTIKDAL